MILPIKSWIGRRLLGDCKSNAPSNSKIAIGTSPNTCYWKSIIGGPLDMLLDRIGYGRSEKA